MFEELEFEIQLSRMFGALVLKLIIFREIQTQQEVLPSHPLPKGELTRYLVFVQQTFYLLDVYHDSGLEGSPWIP